MQTLIPTNRAPKLWHYPFPISTSNQFAKRHTKNSLNKVGYQLAFFDNSALSHLELTDNDGVENTQLVEKRINFFHSKNIRPVLNIEIIGELVKALPPPTDPSYKKLKAKKRVILSTLQQSGLLWALPVRVILDLELNNLQQHSPQAAYEFLHVFADFPLCMVDKNNQRRRYPCDEKLGYYLAPDSPTVTYNGDITRWLEAEILNPSSLLKIKGIFQDFQSTIVNDSNKKLCLANARQATSPFITIWNALVNQENTSGKVLPNERIDTLYGAFALSYCDVFISGDKKLVKRCKDVKALSNLQTSIMTLDQFWSSQK